MVNTRWYGFRGEDEPQPFSYELPMDMKVKLGYLIEEILEKLARKIKHYDVPSVMFEMNQFISKSLKHGLGRTKLIDGLNYDFQNHFYRSDGVEALRTLEITLNAAFNIIVFRKENFDNHVDAVHSMVDRVNKIFRLHACGYQLEMQDGDPDDPFLKIVRFDSEFLHQETVRRPLSLLRDVGFQHAGSQFEDAIREWSEGQYADAITDAGSAFESVMKIILDRSDGAASVLIRDIAAAGYIPSYMEAGAKQLTDLLQMLPNIRNNDSDGHGRLSVATEKMENYARLAINLAGSLIVFLVDEFKRRKV